jgi:hypothetical protein
MSLKVNVGVSRKLTENYNSTGYSLNLEGEIHAPIEDPETVIERVKEFYDLAEEALRQQLERRQGPDAGGTVQDRAPQPRPAPERPVPNPAPAAPRQPPPGNHQPRPGGGGDTASPKQVQFIQTLAKRHRLSTTQLDAAINDALGRPCPLHQLTKRDAGVVIDALNQKADANGTGG